MSKAGPMSEAARGGPIVAGIGCRRQVAAAEIIALVRRALAAGQIDATALAALATADFKAEETALADAAAALGVPLLFLDRAALAAVLPLCPTRSASAAAATGLAAIAESAALAGAGAGASLVLPRIKSTRATCALAQRPPLSQEPT